MKFLANGNLTLALEFDAVAGGELPATGSITIMSPLPSAKVKADGAGCYFGPMTVLVTGVTNSKMSATVPAPSVSVVIQPTSAKVSSGGMFALLEGDSMMGVAMPVTTTVPPTTVPTTFTLKVGASGQEKTQGN